MNKKNYALTAAVLIALSSNCVLFTGCQKDYEGQLEIIKNQIKNGDISVNGLEYKQGLVNEQIEILNEALNSSEDIDKEKVKSIIASLESIKTDLDNTIESLKKAIEDNDTYNSQNIKNDIEAATQKFNTSLLEVSSQINQIDPTLNILDGRTARLDAQIKSMQEKQAAVEKAIADVKLEIDGLGSDMQEQKNKLEGALIKLEEVDAKLNQEIANLQNQVDAVKEATETNAANIEELRNQTIESISSLKNEIDLKINNLANEMAGLSDALTSLGNSFLELNRKYDNLDQKLNDLQEEYNLQIRKIWEKINSLQEGDEQIAELELAVAELQKNMNDLQNTMKMEFEKVLNTLAIYGQELQKIDEILADHNVRLNEMADKLDELGVRLSALESTVNEMKNAFLATIEDVYKKIEALEGQVGNPEMLEQMKKDIAALQELVKANTEDILNIKNDQAQQAEDLAALQKLVTEHIQQAGLNYAELTGKIDAIGEFVNTLDKEIKRVDASIGDMQTEIDANTADILELYKRIENLEQGGTGNYVSHEELTKILSQYCKTEDIRKAFEDVYAKFENYTTKEDVSNIVKQEMIDFQSQLDEMKASVDNLQKQFDGLKKDVDLLMNRIQSMELIADYDNGKIAANFLGKNQYALTLRVETTPPELIEKIANLQGLIELRFKDVIPTRSKGLGITYNINSVRIEKGLLFIDATISVNSPTDESFPYQVAVVLNDGNSYKLTEYRAMYVEDNLYLKAGDEIINCSKTIGNFTSKDVYVRNVLTEQKNGELNIVQIDRSFKAFEEEIMAYYNDDEGVEQSSRTTYSLVQIYDNKNNISNDLIQYINVEPYEGSIRMKRSLDEEGASLEGYKLILQITPEKEVLKKRYICIQLERKN